MKKRKIFCHDFGPKSPEGYSVIFEGIPSGMFYYSSRALVLAEKGDIVILPVDEISWRSIEVIPILNAIGLGPRLEDVIFIGFDKYNRVMDPDSAIKTLKRRRKSAGEDLIDVFTGMAYLPHYLSKRLAVDIMSAERALVRIFDGKDFFQSLNSHFAVPGKVLSSPNQANDFYSRLNGDLMIAKTTHSSAGESAYLLHPDGLGRKEVLSELESGKKFTVQKFLAHQESPSVNLFIAKSGTVFNFFISSQIIGRSSHGTESHEGNVFPVDYHPSIRRFLLSASLLIAKEYARFGYFGPLGVDWIINQTNKNKWYAYAVEVNARTTAPRYVYQAMKKLGAKSFAFKSSHFTAGLAASDLRQKLDSVFWSKKKGYGVIFFNYNAKGKVILAAFGHNRGQALELLTEAEKLIK